MELRKPRQTACPAVQGRVRESSLWASGLSSYAAEARLGLGEESLSGGEG